MDHLSLAYYVDSERIKSYINKIPLEALTDKKIAVSFFDRYLVEYIYGHVNDSEHVIYCCDWIREDHLAIDFIETVLVFPNIKVSSEKTYIGKINCFNHEPSEIQNLLVKNEDLFRVRLFLNKSSLVEEDAKAYASQLFRDLLIEKFKNFNICKSNSEEKKYTLFF